MSMRHLVVWFRDARFARSSTTGGRVARSSTAGGRVARSSTTGGRVARSSTTWETGWRRRSKVRSGAVGAQGNSPAPGAILPVTLNGKLRESATTVTATTKATGGDTARLDAVMVQPLVSRMVLGGDGHGTALLRSSATSGTRTSVAVPGSGKAEISSYDGRGRLLSRTTSTAAVVPVNVAAGGVTLVRR